MPLIKTYAIGNGDMFYIEHGSDSFSIIDCALPDDREAEILEEVGRIADRKGIVRVISTHPDQDHLSGLCELDDRISIRNFYCAKNEATKDDPTSDFIRYCELRDSTKAFHIERGSTRKWINDSDDERGSAGIHYLWPVTSNPHYREALIAAKDAESPNNLSCVVRYALNDGPSAMWMGDLETSFMENVEPTIDLPNTDIFFAPHHGRKSGRVPTKWLSEIDPALIVIGEGPSEYLDYYGSYNCLTQNSAGDIAFDCQTGRAHIYVSSETYQVDFLANENRPSTSHGRYLGTLVL